MPQHIVGKSYLVYDAGIVTVHPGDMLILLATNDQQEAIHYASDHGATVYAYDRCADGALINVSFVYHLA